MHNIQPFYLHCPYLMQCPYHKMLYKKFYHHSKI
nr:MAG TPA: hypothetical protein [Caudoviricetes sp.]